MLRTAEQQLRAILVQAAEAGNYDHLPRVAEWAKVLNAMVAGQTIADSPPAALPTRTETVEDDDDDPPARDSSIQERQAAPRAVAPVIRRAKGGRRKKTRRSGVAASGYPKFVREGESLVKIGWSKSEKKPYEHKAPRTVLRALVKELGRIGAGGERFTVEGIFPLKDASKSDIPDYQAYLTLAWLRSVELITQHGRQGYSLPNAGDLERQSEQKWNELTTR